MQARLLIILCFVLSLSHEIIAGTEYEVKRGAYPYMAFIYYLDETVVDAKGMRFIRSAVLIRPEWLVTSAVGLSIDDGNSNGFPRNTLLARAGATVIDAKLTLNEDEDEQEREIIQIIRPYNYSATQWWRTDISMMKTLLPFNVTTSVGIGTINFKKEYEEKSCIILVYTPKYGNGTDTEDKMLMQLIVDLLPSSMNNCGHHYIENTMICSSDSEENKNAIYDTESFCQGNSGGPLICDGNVIGLQTYIENNCKQPHLYQLLSAWEDFITCSTEDKCQEEHCGNICIVANKDTIQSTATTSKPSDSTTVKKTPSNEKMTKTIIEVGDGDEIDIQTPTLTSIVTTTRSTERSTTEIEMESTSIETVITTGNAITIVKTLDEQKLDTKSWPNEKNNDERKKLEESDDNIERKVNVEAKQQQQVKMKKNRSAAQIKKSIFQNFFFAYLFVACFI